MLMSMLNRRRYVFELIVLMSVLSALGLVTVCILEWICDVLGLNEMQLNNFLQAWSGKLGQIWNVITAIALTAFFSLYVYQRRSLRAAIPHAKTELQMLRAADAQLKLLFSAIPDSQIVSDATGRITVSNGQVQRLLGYTRDDLIGKSVESLIPARYRSSHKEQLRRHLTKPSVRRMGERLIVHAVKKDGTECNVEVTVIRIKAADGICFWSSIRDATECSWTEEQLRISSIAFESSSGVVVTDANAVILRVNGAFTKTFGYSAEESIGRGMSLLKSDRHDESFYSDILKEVIQHGAWKGEIWNKTKDGEVHPYKVSITSVKDSLDVVSHYVGHFVDVTERRVAIEDMTRKNAQLTSIIDNFPGGLTLVDENMRLVAYNDRYKCLLKFPEGLFSTPTSSLENFIPYRAQQGEYGPWNTDQIVADRLADDRKVKPYKFEQQSPDGTVLEIECVPLSTGGFLSTYVDVTERKRAESELRIAAATFESPEATVVTDANYVILRVNCAFNDLTGYSAEDVIGKTPRFLKSGRHGLDFYSKMLATINKTGNWSGEIWTRCKSGQEFQKWLTVSAVRGTDGAVSHYIGTHYDITERKNAEVRIRQLAFFDQLTGLPNRTLLLDRLKQVMTGGARDESFSALLFIDLDHFKTLNDTLGHDIGDLLLKQAAVRLSSCVREVDTVSRFGGDEFVVLLVGLGSNDVEAGSLTKTFAKKLLAEVNKPYLFDHVSHFSTASVGATVFKGQGTSVDELLKQADLAMYRAKDAGRNTLKFFDPTMELVVKDRVRLEDDLRHALDGNQFLLYYQAQVVGNGKVTGAEALLRWQHPTRGLVLPSEFIPLAEETGLILSIGRWVIETACQQLVRWQSNPDMAHFTIAVNVSAIQINQLNFVEQVLEVLESTGANPRHLKLELTESQLIDDVENIILKMSALKTAGVGFSLDDFGTGYSSLSYLKRLPLDQLKIDKSFVHDILTDANDAAIAKTIVALAHSLGLGVIAEGVETGQQREFLAKAGCNACQGYFFSRPLPIDQFEGFALETSKVGDLTQTSCIEAERDRHRVVYCS